MGKPEELLDCVEDLTKVENELVLICPWVLQLFVCVCTCILIELWTLLPLHMYQHGTESQLRTYFSPLLDMLKSCLVLIIVCLCVIQHTHFSVFTTLFIIEVVVGSVFLHSN